MSWFVIKIIPNHDNVEVAKAFLLCNVITFRKQRITINDYGFCLSQDNLANRSLTSVCHVFITFRVENLKKNN